MVVAGFVGAMLLAFAMIAFARIAIADEVLLVGAIGFSWICSLILTISHLIRWAEPIVSWRNLSIAGGAAMAGFAAILWLLLVRGITLAGYYSPDKPASLRRTMPSLRTIAALLVSAAVLILVDSLTGSRGWGWGVGFLLLGFGSMQAWVAPIYRWYLGQRLADIHDFEPDLLASLDRGPVSRHVLRAVKRWAGVEEQSDVRQP
jgi:hypothetical protein